jgi:probable HAF family extracellular repeat protein
MKRSLSAGRLGSLPGSLLASLLLIVPAAASAAPARYVVTPASGKFDRAIGLNNAGTFAVNNLDSNVPYRIGYLTDSQTQESVGTLGGNESVIAGLNNNNEAVGDSTTADGSRHAFLYSAGRLHDLTAEHGIATARAINDRGDIAGESALPGLHGRALVLRGGKVDVFGLPDSTVADINNTGDVVGTYFSSGTGERIFRYSQGGLSDVGIPGSTASQVAGINDAGAIAGTHFTPDGRSHAFLDVAGSITDLAAPLASSTASGINNLGQVVGTVGDRAFLYADGELIDLNDLVDPNAHVLLTSALAINDREQILARACDAEGVFCYATVRLDPVPAVPEAPGRAMLLAGLGGLAVIRIGSGALRFRKSAGRPRVASAHGDDAAAWAAPAAPDAGCTRTPRTGWPSQAPGRP